MFLFSLFMVSVIAVAEVPAVDVAGVDQVLRWSVQRNARAEHEFRARGGQRYPSPRGWSNEVVYQIMVDRFNDGDPSNNSLNIEDKQRRHAGTQLYLDDYRHGGDLRGIIRRLDYLRHLGVTSLWITPILKSQGSYHGYCLQDPTQIDPGFGTAEDLRELVREAHRRGIKVILDIVVNHLCDPDTRYDDEQTPFDVRAYEMCVNDFSSKQYSGYPNTPRGQRRLIFSQTFFGPLKSPYFFSRCGHKAGDFATSGAAAVFGDFSPVMFDLDTTNWDFQAIFTELHKYWIADADIDGFRLDAAKHVTQDFIAYFATQVRAYARRLGKENFFIIGEVADAAGMMAGYVGRMKSEVEYPEKSIGLPPALKARLIQLKPEYQNLFFPFPGLNAVYDFAHSGGMVDVFKWGASPMRVKNWFWRGGATEHDQCGDDFCELAFNGDARMNWNLLEIHDWPRFLMNIASPARVYPALAYLFTAHGVPILYYGMEQGFNGQCDGVHSSVSDPAARRHIEQICASNDFHNHTRYRQDMFETGPWRLGSIVPEIQSLSYIGRGRATGAGDRFANRNHSLYRYVRHLAHLRRTCKSLGDGGIYFRAVHDAPGLLAFARILDDQEVIILINTSDRAIAVPDILVDGTLNGGRLGRRYRNVFNTSEAGVVTRDGNAVRLRLDHSRPFNLRPQSAAIFVLEEQLSKPAGDSLAVCAASW